ncbi:hypothetical protein Pmani_026137 [Petrolisthes manimaculis]|uniref:G-protein coupled receptors family 1 profile domain-containing protein n=1 Tax=Petrolisthes manimaculis TaxID=1843537 RepID=A0AAE1P5A8_9EUCA|nr:hypothetical protein Pmani_026137 [Petrolisthes manimaculis]
MPLTLIELLSQYWPLGKEPSLCKLVGTSQAVCIFVSTMSITAIALDRFQVQYCLPIIMVSISYAMIYRKLKHRNNSSLRPSSVTRTNNSSRHDSRVRKTNTLLVTIALIFCLSWLPLNLFNVIVDFTNPFYDDPEAMVIVYAVCHLIGMSSACSNPLLYGYFNDNFKRQFFEIFTVVCRLNKTSERPAAERGGGVVYGC